jgi:uncharacterized membrane protein YkvI
VKRSLFNRLFLPGFLLQSIVIGGGYATGRELVEFFLSAGPVGGVFGMLVATVLFSIASALCFEFARLTRSFNYRSFFGALLGPGWFLYEIAYGVLGLLVLAVIAAAAGEMIAVHWAWPRTAGILLLIAPIGLLVFRGTALIEKVLAAWSFVLYATYVVLVVLYLHRYGGDLADIYAASPAAAGWFARGVKYFGYNLAVIPLVLFCVPHMRSRGDAIAAGLLAGPLVMLPAAMFYVAMSASWPEIAGVAVPADFMLQRLDLHWLQAVFYIVVFGTFVETGTGFIHALNERIELHFHTRAAHMPAWLRPAIAAAALACAAVLAVRFGIIDLIAKGYGTLTWVIVAVFALPLATVGVWRIAGSRAVAAPPESGTN